MSFRPLGARLLVKPIVSTLSLVERGKLSNLEVVVEDDNRPQPTQGEVIALGEDPLLRELVKVGDIVHFSRFAGHNVTLQDEEYRMLEMQEVTAVMDPVKE